VSILALGVVLAGAMALPAMAAPKVPPTLTFQTVSDSTVVPTGSTNDFGLSVGCDTANGYRATGGGGTIDDLAAGVLLESSPEPLGGFDNGAWSIRYRSESASFVGSTITAWVVCAKLG
jgi:hypothetical protein